jgi:hypothetical protein
MRWTIAATDLLMNLLLPIGVALLILISYQLKLIHERLTLMATQADLDAAIAALPESI